MNKTELIHKLAAGAGISKADFNRINVRTYLFQEYTPELAQAHGVRAAYPSFGIEYIQNVLQTNINSAFLALA